MLIIFIHVLGCMIYKHDRQVGLRFSLNKKELSMYRKVEMTTNKGNHN